jgi:putative drug exporter of the RND superfamily
VRIFATALGGGILIDDTIIRGILAAAAVTALGRWKWWRPQRLSGAAAARPGDEVLARSGA